MCLQGAVCDVIDMCGKVVALVAFGDEGAQFDVLDGDFLAADVVVEDAANLFFAGLVCLHQLEELLGFLFVQLFLEAVEQSVECHFGGVGDITEDGVFQVASDGGIDTFGQLFAEGFSLTVDVAVGASTEIDAFEGACVVATGRENLCEGDGAILVDGQCLACLQFVDVVSLHAEGGLNDGSLGGHHQHLFVLIPEGRTDAPRVAHGKHFATARESAQHIAAIEHGGGGAEYVGDVDVVFDVVGDVGAFQPLLTCHPVDAFALAVESVTHQFEHDVGVVVDAWMLSFGGDVVEHLIYIGEIEVATKTEVLGTPVVAAHEGMHMSKTALACGGVAEMPHEDLSPLPTSPKRGGVAYCLKYFGDGTAAESTFAQHIFLSWLCIEVGAGNTCPLLSPIVLLLHEEIEFVESVGGGAIFLFIVTDGLEQANHRHATFMFERFHVMSELGVF